ncbi:lamin tail domain-containing protein [Siccirubricoccus deserti]
MRDRLPGTVGRVFVSEVAPWSSGDSPIGADWFEVTNGTASTLDITGWKMDDSSGSPAAAVALNGITTIAPGESVIFIETADLEAAKAAFLTTWFGGNPPANCRSAATAAAASASALAAMRSTSMTPATCCGRV